MLIKSEWEKSGKENLREKTKKWRTKNKDKETERHREKELGWERKSINRKRDKS